MIETTTSTKTPKSLTTEAVLRAALADPDAHPLTEIDLVRMKRTPRVKVIRRALELTQEEFATRYHIPVGTLRDWEKGRTDRTSPREPIRR